MSFMQRVKQKMGKSEAMPTHMADLIARHKSVRDETRALVKAAKSLAEAHTALSIATMDARTAVDALGKTAGETPEETPHGQRFTESEAAKVSEMEKELQCLHNDVCSHIESEFLPVLDAFLEEDVPQAKEMRDRYKKSHLVLTSLSEKVKELEAKDGSKSSDKTREKLREAREDLERHNQQHEELESLTIAAYKEMEAKRDVAIRTRLGALLESEHDTHKVAFEWLDALVEFFCGLQGKEPPVRKPKQRSSSQAAPAAENVTPEKPKLWQPPTGATAAMAVEATAAAKLDPGPDTANDKTQRPGSIPPPAPPPGSLGRATDDEAAKFFNPAELDKGTGSVGATLGAIAGGGGGDGETLHDLETKIQLQAASYTLRRAREHLDVAKEKEEFEECLRLQRGMRQLETLRDELRGSGDEDEQAKIALRITAACNRLGLEPQDENTDL